MNVKWMAIVCITLAQCVAYDRFDAVQIPSVNAFEARTGLKVEGYLEEALADSDWQEANRLLNQKSAQIDIQFGKRNAKSINYAAIIGHFHKSSARGITLAAFQGFVTVAMFTRRTGTQARRDLAVFASQLMQDDICDGYLHLAQAYAQQELDGRMNLNDAIKMLNRGQKACNRIGLQAWIPKVWHERLITYQAVQRYNHARMAKGASHE